MRKSETKIIPTYEQHVTNILKNGVKSAPRGLGVTQTLNAKVMFRAGEMPGRKGINWSLGLMEGLQLVAGIFDHEAIARVAPKAKLELFTEQSAYGPRVADQVPRVIKALQDDPQDRRAVLILPRPEEVGTSAMPCTTSIQFHIVPGPWSGLGLPVSLAATVNMRSSDAVWGLSYDIVQFGMLVQAVAYCLGVDPGTVTMFLGNAHVYDTTRFEPAPGGSFEIKLPAAHDGHRWSWLAFRGWAAAEVGRAPWADHRPGGMLVNIPKAQP